MNTLPIQCIHIQHVFARFWRPLKRSILCITAWMTSLRCTGSQVEFTKTYAVALACKKQDNNMMHAYEIPSSVASTDAVELS